MNALLDTCAVLDLLLKGYTPPLPASWGVSAISFYEIAWKHRLGKLHLGPSVSAFFDDVKQAGAITVPVDDQISLEAATLAWDHHDPADRMIVATAAAKGLTLITRDRVVSAFYQDSRW